MNSGRLGFIGSGFNTRFHIKSWSACEALKQAAVEAVRQWKFTPTILEGKPIRILGTITVNFHL
jgi:TonB-like protein